MKPEIIPFDSRGALSLALAGVVATELAAVLSRRTRAALAVPAEWSDPAFDDALFRHALDWARVHLTASDAAWPGRDDTAFASRPTTARDTALRFTALRASADTPEAAAGLAADAVTAHILPLDVCVLAMGDDGRIAGLVPGGDRLEEAINPVCREPVLPIRAPGGGEVRLTLTLPAIQSATWIGLVLTGPAALASLERASGAGPVADPPVRALVRGPRRLTAFYTP